MGTEKPRKVRVIRDEPRRNVFDDIKPDVPIHRNAREAEILTAKKITPRRGITSIPVMRYLASVRYSTDDAGSIATGIFLNTYASCRNGLMNKGLVEEYVHPNGLGTTSRGNPCHYWCITELGRQWLADAPDVT